MKLYCLYKVAQQIVGVSQVSIGSSLGSSVPEFFDQTQVLSRDV